MHQKRGQPYIKFLDADGQWRYRFGKGKPEDDAIPRDVHLQAEVIELHELFIANHHVPADAADDGDASDDHDAPPAYAH